MVNAACSSCGRRYQVADPQKKYHCKKCGGIVRALQRESKPKVKAGLDIEGWTCPHCSAFHPSFEVLYCDNCGEPFEDQAGSAKKHVKETARRGADEHTAVEKIEKALKYLFAMRILFIIGATIYGGVAMKNILLAVSSANVDSSLIALLSAVFCLIICGTMVFSALKVYLYPMVISIVPACLVTLFTILWYSSIPFSLHDIFQNLFLSALLTFQLMIMIPCWVAVFAATVIHRNLRYLPGMYVSERGKLCRERRTDTRHARRLEAQKRAFNRKVRFYGLFAGIAAVAVIVITVIALQSKKPEKPPSMAETAALFAETWNASNGGEDAAIKIAFFFQEDSVRKMERLLMRRFIKYEWVDRLPRIGSPIVGDPNGGYCRAVYPMSVQDTKKLLITNWKYSNGSWDLSSIRYPEDL